MAPLPQSIGSVALRPTVPLLLPTTVSVYGMRAKVAFTFWLLPAGVKVQLFVLDTQAPPKPTNCDPTAGVAVRITGLPSNMGSEQSAPQLIPSDVTVPLPAPAFTTLTTVRARELGVTVVLALRAKAQVALVAPPAHVTPVQLTKVNPA